MVLLLLTPFIMVMSIICKYCRLVGSQLSVLAQYAAIAIVGSRSNCSCCCGVPVALGGKDVMVAMMLIKDMLTLLLLLKDC